MTKKFGRNRAFLGFYIYIYIHYIYIYICFDISSVEQSSTKEISLKFSPMTSSVASASTDKSNLVETFLTTITEHVQVQNTAAPIMYTVPVSNIALNQQQAEIAKIATEPFSATPTLQETLKTMMSRMTQMGIPCLKCRHCTCSQFAVLSTPQSSFNPCCPSSCRGHSKLCSFWTRADFLASSRVTSRARKIFR